MKIGKLVRAYIQEIFDYCEKNPNELSNLMDKKYSKNKFDINFPFCMEVDSIPAVQASGKVSRFWKESYRVCGKTLRVTSQWFESSRPQFLRYLVDKNLISQEDAKNLPGIDQSPNAEGTVKTKHTQRSPSGNLYRYNTDDKESATMKFTTVILVLLVVGGCIVGGALAAGFIRGVLVENDPEYYILVFAAVAGLVATWGLVRLINRP